ncbi:MAG: putative Na+/H+ antiporter [Rhodoferax sp.]|nr:putative Na+/H+ antiporter [Rhodoferax sp.]
MSPFELVCGLLFALAIVHTFSTKYFEHLAHLQPHHAGLWHWLGEVEVVFGFWALVLAVTMFLMLGSAAAVEYIDTRNYTEPMFVFAVMVIAATRPILQAATALLQWLAGAVPLAGSLGYYLVVMVMVPLMGSFITEPAAMTLAALILGNRFFARNLSTRLKYATLGVLFVNISVGGTLTSFAAPPVLMVAAQWGWDTSFMASTFGWKAAIAVVVNTVGVSVWFRKELAALPLQAAAKDAAPAVPRLLVAVHLAFLAGVVVFAHHPAIFMGLFLFFLGIAHAYEHHQDRLILKEGLLVAFFLAGLVVLGGQQQWWLQPLLMRMSSDVVFGGAIALTAFTDNAALTYLGSLVEGLSDSFKYALVAGAVTGGGLTIIANAPNPAGIAILRQHFDEGVVHPLGLLVAALPPTVVAAVAFWVFR